MLLWTLAHHVRVRVEYTIDIEKHDFHGLAHPTEKTTRETGAEVVISSTKRRGRTRAQLVELLEDRGFVGTVRGMTPEHVSKMPGGSLYRADSRGHEIYAWLQSASLYGIDVKAFVILDDDSDMAHLADRLIKTTFDTGLLNEHVDRAIEMLRAASSLIVIPTNLPNAS